MTKKPTCCLDDTHPAGYFPACYCAQNYAPLPVVIESGRGEFLYDENGVEYIDAMSAYSAANLGHSNPSIIKAAHRQMKKLGITSRAMSHNLLCEFSRELCSLFEYDSTLLMNTGVEAVETAIKVARKWGYVKKGIPQDKAEILVANNNFHGRTLTVISFSSCEQYKDGFGPLTPGFREIPFNNPSALAAAINDNTVAFLVEPIQGEGGIVIPTTGYLKACFDICEQHKVLLLCDEIQSGLGRTGKLLASSHDGIKPHGVMLGKSLGGGLFPVSAFLANHDVMDVIHPGDHGSTFGGNPLACAIGLKTLELFKREPICENSEKKGRIFLEKLKKIKSTHIKEIRGKGLMIGLELNNSYGPAKKLAHKLLKHQIITKDTRESVLRLTPPLVIQEKSVNKIVSALNTELKE